MYTLKTLANYKKKKKAFPTTAMLITTMCN